MRTITARPQLCRRARWAPLERIVFYHHRPDLHTPLEETLAALDQLVRTGKTLYIGLSNYSGEELAEAMRVCAAERFSRPIIHQPRYSMLERGLEVELLPVAARERVGLICFSPLAQGLLSDKYLEGVPAQSRAAQGRFLKPELVTPALRNRLARLNVIAQARGLPLAQLAIAWVLRFETVSSALVGASRPQRIIDLVAAAEAPALDMGLLSQMDEALLSSDGESG